MISKDNRTLQITIKKSDLEKLKSINEILNKRFNLDFSKSQTIQFLINNFNDKKTTKEPTIKTAQIITNKKDCPNDETKADFLTNDLNETKRKTNALKNKIKLSNPKLAKELGINEGNLKHYLYGQRTPTGKNAEILADYYKKYGIN